MRFESVPGGDGEEPVQRRGDLDERWLDLVFRQVPGAVWATDRDLRLVWVAGRVPTMQYASADVVGKTVFEYVGSEDPAHPAVAAHRAALDGRRAQLRLDWEGRCYEMSIEPLATDDAVIGAVGVAIDVTDRQRAEGDLKRNEARLRAAERLAHVGSWEWDTRVDHVEWSDEMHRIFGLEPGTFSGRFDDYLARIHEEDRARVQEAILSALRTACPLDLQHRILVPGGEVRVLHCRGHVLDHGDGLPHRLLGSALDVTEQVAGRRELEHTVSLLLATLNSTADGLLVVDSEGRITAANDRFLELWQLPRRLLEQGIDDRLLAAALEQLEDPEGFRDRVRALYGSPTEESFDEVRFLDGRVFERYSRPQRLGDEIVGRVWSFRDVTERTRLFARATFLSDASRLLATLDAEQALRSIAGLAVSTRAEACAVDLFDGDGPRRLVTVTRGDEPAELAAASASPPGRAQLYQGTGRSWMSVPVRSKAKLLAGLRVVAQTNYVFTEEDLDTAVELATRVALALENARVHEEACEALRARDEVLAIAAHEIRGPLTSMRLAIQTLKQKAVASEEAPVFDLLERENRRLARFVDELLDAVRVRGGLLSLRLEEVDLGEVVHEVVTRMQEELQRCGSRVTVAVEQHIVGVWDRDRLDQAIGNLLSNACKYGLGRPITLEAEARDGEALISVIDEGIGIAAEKQAHLFEPFERGVSSRHYGGLGLGLYIVRSIAESLGGSIEVESELGRGSVFRLRLPLGRGDA